MIPKKKWTQSQVIGSANTIHDQMPNSRSPSRSAGPHRSIIPTTIPQKSPGLNQGGSGPPHKPLASDILDLSSTSRKNSNFIVRPYMNNNQPVSGYNVNSSDIAALSNINGHHLNQQQLLLLQQQQQQQQQQKQYQMLHQLHYQQQQNLVNPSAMKLQPYIPSVNHSAKPIPTDHSKKHAVPMQHSPSIFPGIGSSGHSGMLQGSPSPATSNASNVQNVQNGLINASGGNHHQHLLNLQNMPYNSGNFSQLNNPSMRSSAAVLAALSAAVSQQNSGAQFPNNHSQNKSNSVQLPGHPNMLSNLNAQLGVSQQHMSDLNIDARKNVPVKPDMFPPWLDYIYTMDNNLPTGTHQSQIYQQQLLAEHERQLRVKESAKDNKQDASKIRDDNYQILRESKEVSFNMNSNTVSNYNSQEDMVDHHFQLSLKHNQSGNPHRSATSSPRCSTSRSSLHAQSKNSSQYSSLSPHSQLATHQQKVFNQPQNASPPTRMINGQQLPSQCINIYNNFSPDKQTKPHDLNRSTNSLMGPSLKETTEAMVENFLKKDRVSISGQLNNYSDSQTRASSNSSAHSAKLPSNFNAVSVPNSRHNQQTTPSISSVSPTSSLSSSRSTSTPNGGLPHTRLEDLNHSTNSNSSVTINAINNTINNCLGSQPPPTESPNPSESGSLGGATASSSGGGTCSIMPLKKRIMMRYNESPVPSTSHSPIQSSQETCSKSNESLTIKSEPDDSSPNNNSQTTSPKRHHHSPSIAGTKRKRSRKNSSSDNNLTSDFENNAPVKKRRGRTPNGTKTIKTEASHSSNINNEHHLLPDPSSIPAPLTASQLEDKQLNEHSREHYKQQGTAFLQDDDCFKVAPKLAKCRACRQHPQQFCRFWGFRKLQFGKKGVATAGFSELTDADKNHRALWSMHYPVKPDLNVESARYILELIGGKFCEIVQEELEGSKILNKSSGDADVTISQDGGESGGDGLLIAWKRAVQMVSEMCDVCDASVFNTHYVCKKCGFTVCLDCMRENDTNKDCEGGGRNKSHLWPLCNRQPHFPDKLLLTHVIPSGCLSTLSLHMHQICREAGIKLACTCFYNNSHNNDKDATDDYNTANSPMGGLHFLADIALKCPSGATDSARPTSPNGVSAPVLSPAHAPVPVNNSSLRSSKCSEQLLDENGRIKVLRLDADEHLSNIDSLQAEWQSGRPIVMSSCDKSIDSTPWLPRALCKEFGSMEASMVNCETGVSLKSHPMRTFWDGFESVRKRIPGKEGRPVCLRLEWPRSDNIINQMTDRFKNLSLQITPISNYIHASGSLNLLARLPEFFGPPDLTPRLLCAYGMARNCSVGTYNLRLFRSDTSNILLYVGSLEEEDEKREKNDIANSLRIAGVDAATVKRNEQSKAGALWHVFSPNDADAIRHFLRHESSRNCGSSSPTSDSESQDVDPFEELRHYLGPQLLDKLERDCGIRPVTFVQFCGDAVLVPTGAPFQVRNLASCISVSSQFVSPESLPVCFRLNQRMRSTTQPATSSSCQQEERLQIKNIMFHSVKDASSVLLCSGALKPPTHTTSSSAANSSLSVGGRSSSNSCPPASQQKSAADSRERSPDDSACPQLQPCA